MKGNTRRFWTGTCMTIALLVSTPSAQQLRDISVSDQDAQEQIHRSFVQGYLLVPMGGALLKALPAARRLDVLQLAGAMAKAYVNTDLFRRRYAQDLAEAPEGQRHPKPPQKFEDFVKESRAAVEHNIAEVKKETAIPADQRAEIEEAMRVQLRQITGANAEQRAGWEAEERDRFAQESEAYKEALAQGRALPQDPKELVRMRLRQFLAQTADVDFNAQLKTVDGRQKFVVEDYEVKPSIWKSCYRAGRLATEAARAFAAAWLKELGR